MLLAYPHRAIKTSYERIERLRRKYIAFKKAHGYKPLFYPRRDRWMPIPKEFLNNRE
jgi:hypothetical protein